MARLLGLHPLQLSSVEYVAHLLSLDPSLPLWNNTSSNIRSFPPILSTSVIEKESTKFLEGSRTR